MAGSLRLLVALGTLFATGASASAEEESDISGAVRAVLVAQGEAWNRGDLSGYMAAFARDTRTRHVFNGEVTTGYTAIEARFRTRYPDPRNMGTISFSDLTVSVLAPDTAYAFAHWTFQDGPKMFTGVFTLIFRLIDREWVIVHDHSTALSGE